MIDKSSVRITFLPLRPVVLGEIDDDFEVLEGLVRVVEHEANRFTSCAKGEVDELVLGCHFLLL